MAVVINTNNPNDLLLSIRYGIDTGSTVTWEYDSDGDFLHSPNQWRGAAWFRPRIEPNKLIFNIFPPANMKLKKTVYAVYHGRFIEMLLAHFDHKFVNVYASSYPEYPDNIG